MVPSRLTIIARGASGVGSLPAVDGDWLQSGAGRS